MSFDPALLASAIDRLGPVIRVVVADIRGSTPREVGAAMLVGAGGQEGTIGGGTLEYRASLQAREMLKAGQSGPMLRKIPLGPELGQCCGGAVTLLFEYFDAGRITTITDEVADSGLFRRPVTADAAATPPRGHGLVSGWMIEQLAPRAPHVWIYGAGHVGRALVNVLAPLGAQITWVDTAQDRFPDDTPEQVTTLVAARPAQVVQYADPDAHHLVMTYSHAMDLEICHALLGHAFASAGLIGSVTKWARFRNRLAALGHTRQQIERITCPIGMPELGKAPEFVALGVATTLFREIATSKSGTQHDREIAS